MSRLTILNIVLGVIAAGLVATLVVLEATGDPAPTTTTTTSTTTTTTIPPTTTTTTTVPPTTTTTTTTTTTVPPTTQVPDDPFFVAVVVVNGTNEGEVVGSIVERVRELGYSDVRGLNGSAKVADTRVYAADEEFLGEADALAVALGFDLDTVEVATFAEAPQVSGLATAKVMLYVGRSGLPEPGASEGGTEEGSDATDGDADSDPGADG